MRVVLTREPSTDAGTFGRVEYPGGASWSLELPWRDNRRQRSCIPLGEYRCAIVLSPRFGRVYGVAGVPGRDAILIHPANWAGDVELGFASQLQGCIALGERRGQLRTPSGAMQPALLVSRPAVSQFMAALAGQPFTLRIQ